MSNQNNAELAAFVGLDWADQQHVVSLQEAGSNQTNRFTLDQTPEGPFRRGFNNCVDVSVAAPSRLPVEQKRGALIYALMHVDFLHLYPVNPQTLAKMRQAFYPSGAKDDPQGCGSVAGSPGQPSPASACLGFPMTSSPAAFSC